MSVLFKKVPLKTLDAMEKALEKDPDRVREACLELEQPDENGLPILCSDDSVFSMLFDLLESDVCEELRQGGRYARLMDFWQEDCDAMDLILLTPEIIKPLRACFSSLDFDIPAFIEDFAYDYDVEESAVSAALQSLMSAMIASAGDALLFVME
ncbi:MAG: hypothetical protein ACI4I8_02495 [Oscillospiraceae bacterium]